MRLHLPVCAACALVVGFGLTPIARADNWFTRMFSKPKQEEPAEKKPVGPSPEELARLRQERARKEFAERSAVVLKLREIAERNNDPELIRQADQLDQRVYETYKRRLGITDRTLPEEERSLEEQITRQAPQGGPRIGELQPTGQASLRRD
ncbi:MAG: hypothetical protein U0744_16005 [Gemmataceae bacterium]